MLLKSRNIEINLGLLNNLLQNHRLIHIKHTKIYFVPRTIRIKPKYKSIEKNYKPFLNTNHPIRQETQQTHQYLYRFIHNHFYIHKARVLNAIVITQSSIPQQSNIFLFDPSIHMYNLLNKMEHFSVPPEHILYSIHPIEILNLQVPNINKLPNTIHKKIYDKITTSNLSTMLILLKIAFPYIPIPLFKIALECQNPIHGYHKPLPSTIHPPPIIHNTNYSNLEAKIVTWNIAFMNTSIPCLYSFIQQNNSAIFLLQETKLTAKKPPKFIQNLFPNYKLIFNNTNKITQRSYYLDMEFRFPRGGLLTLIHNKYNYPTNITKTKIEPNLIPYLQIIKINNHLLIQIIIINLYMLSHQNDLHLILNILKNITTTINKIQNHIIILGGDFNKDVALIGHTNKYIHTLPNENDHQWHKYIIQLNYQYISTSRTYNKQGGNNYSNTNLKDGFYIYNAIPTQYTSTISINFQQNLNHFF